MTISEHQRVKLFLLLDVVPSEQIIDIGRQARIECLTEEKDRSSITWRKDGKELPSHARIVVNRQVLQIFNLQTGDYGMYQCFVKRGSGHREAQAASELRLGGESDDWREKKVKVLTLLLFSFQMPRQFLLTLSSIRPCSQDHSSLSSARLGAVPPPGSRGP